MYNVLVDTIQYKHVEEIFFGTDYPAMAPREARDGLYEVTKFAEGTNLLPVPRKTIVTSWFAIH